MNANREFYLARAAECAEQADAASLTNVVERLRRSEAAWQAMADRLGRIEDNRARDTKAKADAAEVDDSFDSAGEQD